MLLHLVLYVLVILLHSCLLVFTWRRIVLLFFNLKQLLRISCIYWCYFRKLSSFILQSDSLRYFSVVLLGANFCCIWRKNSMYAHTFVLYIEYEDKSMKSIIPLNMHVKTLHSHCPSPKRNQKHNSTLPKRMKSHRTFCLLIASAKRKKKKKELVLRRPV